VTHRLTNALAAAMLLSSPAFAQELIYTTAARPANVGLIEVLSAREGALFMVSDRLSRIETNVKVGTRPDGVLARLAAAAGPKGWPAGAYNSDILAAIDDWRLSLIRSLANASDQAVYGFVPTLSPDWTRFEPSAAKQWEDVEPPVPVFFFDAPLPAIAAPTFHEVLPSAQVGGGFFGSF